MDEEKRFRWTPDQQLADTIDSVVEPYVPLLRNAQRAGLPRAIHPLKTIMFWLSEEASWNYTRGLYHNFASTWMAQEIPLEERHIPYAAKSLIFELSGAKSDIPARVQPFGREIQSDRFGTKLTGDFFNDELIASEDPGYRPLRTDNRRRLSYQDPKIQQKIIELCGTFGASDAREITTPQDRQDGMTVFERDTNVGVKLYEVIKGGDVHFYGKIKEGQTKRPRPPAPAIPSYRPVRHAVRPVIDIDLAADSALLENPYQLVRKNAMDNGFVDAEAILDSAIFWNGERPFWETNRIARRSYSPSYDIYEYPIKDQVLHEHPEIPLLVRKYIATAADRVALELSGVTGEVFDKWHDKIRSDDYGTRLTEDPFHGSNTGEFVSLPYGDPEMNRRIHTLYLLNGAKRTERLDVTTEDARDRGDTVFASPTNLGLTLFEIVNGNKDPRNDVELWVKAA